LLHTKWVSDCRTGSPLRLRAIWLRSRIRPGMEVSVVRSRHPPSSFTSATRTLSKPLISSDPRPPHLSAEGEFRTPAIFAHSAFLLEQTFPSFSRSYCSASSAATFRLWVSLISLVADVATLVFTRVLNVGQRFSRHICSSSGTGQEAPGIWAHESDEDDPRPCPLAFRRV
jgi:hypothetical protein